MSYKFKSVVLFLKILVTLVLSRVSFFSFCSVFILFCFVFLFSFFVYFNFFRFLFCFTLSFFLISTYIFILFIFYGSSPSPQVSHTTTVKFCGKFLTTVKMVYYIETLPLPICEAFYLQLK